MNFRYLGRSLCFLASGVRTVPGFVDDCFRKFCERGKSGLHWVAQRVTPFDSNVRNSGTERMSRALILETGTGVFRGAAGVKTAKLCVKQDQIGERLSVPTLCFRVRSLEG